MIYQNTLRYVAGTLEALAESVWLARGIACHQDAEASGELPKSAAAFFFISCGMCEGAAIVLDAHSSRLPTLV